MPLARAGLGAHKEMLAGRLVEAAAELTTDRIQVISAPFDGYLGQDTDTLDYFEAMLVDKKARGSRLRFVILDAIGSTEGPATELTSAGSSESTSSIWWAYSSQSVAQWR